MSAQLPYLPPLLRTGRDIATIAAQTADDVRAAQSGGAKAGIVARGALATLPAIVNNTNETLAAPARAVAGQVADFGQALFGGAAPQPAPALNLPALATPAPPVAAVAPATQAPVAATSTGTLVSGRQGNNVAVAGINPTPPAAQNLPVIYRSSPVATGISQQSAYAEQQRQAVIAAALQSAAAGNPDNASYRFAAALHALPSLSGTNNFAATQAQSTAEAARTAEAERANIRTTEASRYSAEVAAENVRRQIQSVVIGQQPNPDPVTKMIHPFIPLMGVATIGKDGKPVVTDMQGKAVAVPGAETGAAATPIVGSRTSQKDGTYAHGSKSVTIKGGVITEVK